jgi:hypothetical protein
LIALVADLQGGLAAEAVHWYFLSKEHVTFAQDCARARLIKVGCQGLV